MTNHPRITRGPSLPHLPHGHGVAHTFGHSIVTGAGHGIGSAAGRSVFYAAYHFLGLGPTLLLVALVLLIGYGLARRAVRR